MWTTAAEVQQFHSRLRYEIHSCPRKPGTSTASSSTAVILYKNKTTTEFYHITVFHEIIIKHDFLSFNCDTAVGDGNRIYHSVVLVG